jgi:hypothetical protein
MTEHISDPILIAIERHRLADAALDESIGRGADEAIKKDRVDREGVALVALLRTKPETLTGCLAVLRYVCGLGGKQRCRFIPGLERRAAIRGL